MSPPESLGHRDFHRSPLSGTGGPVAGAPHAGNGSGGAHGAGTDPLAWARTDRPLRVAILGWARLSSQGKEGSGYNLNKSELARGLALSGHEVVCLQSGMGHRLPLIGAGGLRGGRARIEHREDWAGVRCYELLNAPNVSPSAMNFRNVEEEISSPETTRLVLAWLREVRAEVVHVHSLEGYGLDLIGAIEDAGIPVVATLHNYWFVCPQVDLLHREREVCADYDGGRRCLGCLPGTDVRKYKRQRAMGQSLEWLLGVYPADVVRKLGYGLRPALRGLVRRRGGWIQRYRPPVLNPEHLTDRELALGFDEDGRGPGAADGCVHQELPLAEHERARDYTPAPWDTNEQVLGGGREVHLRVLNEYGRRRHAGVEALSRASLVTPPSDYLRRVHVAMGVPEERTRWVRLGQPHFDQINRRARRSPYYGMRPWDPTGERRPLRFAFFGTVRPNKGLEVLTRAIPLLETHIRQRCQFTVHALGWEAGFRKRLSRFPEVAVWGGYDLLQLIGSGGDYDVGILPHIWLENSPLVLLENFHAGKFVVCSRLGGPVDWVKEGVNGLLFPGGDERALAACIKRLVTGDVVIPSPKEVHEATELRSYPEHVREVEGIYREVIQKKRAGGEVTVRRGAVAGVLGAAG